MALNMTLRRGVLSIALLGLALLILPARAMWLAGAAQQAAPAPVLEPAFDGLRSPNAFERANAVKALRASHDSAAAPALIADLDDSDQAVGLYVAQTLGELTPESMLPQLRDALQDSNADVRWRAAMALGELHDAGAVNALTVTLRDSDPLVQRQAADALAKIGGEDAVHALVSGLDSAQESTAEAAMAGLEAVGDPAVPALSSALTSPQARVRVRAATVLGYLGDPQARPALQLATIDQDPAVRAAVQWALSQLPE